MRLSKVMKNLENKVTFQGISPRLGLNLAPAAGTEEDRRPLRLESWSLVPIPVSSVEGDNTGLRVR
jgi:hypothetical protein